MEPALLVAATWLFFFGTHLGLASEPFRGALVRRLGSRGFFALFYAVAAVTFTIWVVVTAAVRVEGLPGLALGEHVLIRILAMAGIVTGLSLSAGGLASYPSSPMALPSHPVRAPRGVDRITRHPFFAGLALFALGHVLIVPTLAAAVFFAGIAFQAVVGAAHQDRKLAHRLGPPYCDYLARTSAVPFAAILLGRQRLSAFEQPWIAYAVGALFALGLRQLHAHLFDHGGLWIVGSVLGGTAYFSRHVFRVSPARKPQHV
jgi:uncharacterized membrane protein